MKKANSFWIRVFAGILAFGITLALYLTKSPPFSMLTAQATEAASASPQATDAPESSTPAVGGEQLMIVVHEPFDQTIEAASGTQAPKAGADTWMKTLTLINTSDKPIPVYLFIQGLDACAGPESTNCIQFQPSVTVPAGGSQTVTVSFMKIALTGYDPLEGKLILAGGGIQREIPFSINGAWQKTSFDYAQVGDWIITALLAALILYIVYLLLYSKVFPLFQSERSMPLRMEITDDNKALWAIFSSRLKKMQEQGYGQQLTNPRPKGETIDLPTNLGKEGEVFKAVLDLLSWILPRRGKSIRLQSIEDPTNGKGISVALVQNNDDQILAQRLFLSGEYGLTSQSGSVEPILMIPVILWLTDWVDQYTQRKPTKQRSLWEVQAYCELARILWTSDRGLGRKLYMEALFRDSTNKQAQAGLGRIWLEECQEEDNQEHKNQEHKRADCLNFAISYLEQVAQAQPESLEDVTWYASTYNLAVAYIYWLSIAKSEKEKEQALKEAVERCDKLFKKIKEYQQSGTIDESASNSQKGKGENFSHWLGRFKFMAGIFKRSVELEKNHPVTQEELDQKISQAINGLKREMAGLNTANPAPAKQKLLEPKDWLLVTLDYRSQYNAACYFSRCYTLAEKFPNRNIYAETALDYLRLALAHGGGLADYAREDQALKPLRSDFKEEFEDIAPKKEPPKEEKKDDENVLHVVVKNSGRIKKLNKHI